MPSHYYNIHTHLTAPCLQEANSIVSITPEEMCIERWQGLPFVSLSLHPWSCEEAEPPRWREWAELPQVVTIGECGLDKLRGASLTQQESLFITQIHLSEAVQKPLLIHCVRAFDRLLYLHKTLRPTQPWVVHGFRGKPELARSLQERGIYLSLGEHLRADTTAQLNDSLLLVESDMSPLPLSEIYQQIASQRGCDVAQLAQRIEANVARLFPRLVASR